MEYLPIIFIVAIIICLILLLNRPEKEPPQEPKESPQEQEPKENPQEQEPKEIPREQKPKESSQEQEPKEIPQKTKPKKTPRKPKPQTIPEHDSEKYNLQGYNEVGRNRQGKYNRYYNVKCYRTGLYSEEGFLDIRKNPLYLTDHARDRMYERMGIIDFDRMDKLAFEAYQFGKSKLQLMKSERGIIEEKELEYGDSVILIYHGYCYVFTENNGLKTVYKNDRVKI